MAAEDDAQPSPGRARGRKFTQMAIILTLMVGEGIAVYFLANTISTGPDFAVGAEGGKGDAQADGEGPGALSEVELAECRPGNSTSGKYISFSIRVSALVASADRQRAERLVKDNQARIQDRVNYVIRSAELKHLYEPGFETVKRRLKHEMDQLFDDEGLIKGILIPELLQ
ncbi:MAG: hypothetical protein ACE5HE_02170 [Phycisphaerae bacterium]